jgi:hypothetical protein
MEKHVYYSLANEVAKGVTLPSVRPSSFSIAAYVAIETPKSITPYTKKFISE